MNIRETYFRPRVMYTLEKAKPSMPQILRFLREGKIVDILAPLSRYPWRNGQIAAFPAHREIGIVPS